MARRRTNIDKKSLLLQKGDSILIYRMRITEKEKKRRIRNTHKQLS